MPKQQIFNYFYHLLWFLLCLCITCHYNLILISGLHGIISNNTFQGRPELKQALVGHIMCCPSGENCSDDRQGNQVCSSSHFVEHCENECLAAKPCNEVHYLVSIFQYHHIGLEVLSNNKINLDCVKLSMIVSVLKIIQNNHTWYE